MTIIRFLLLLFVAALTLQVTMVSTGISAPDANDDRPVTTVEKVDLDRYTGRWYEIAKIPNRFQKQCSRETTAEYTLREDGRVTVVNRCIKDNGDLDEIEGVAKIVDASGNTKLKVSFVSFLGWRPFWGDYWVIGLDEAYQWAVVGTPDRKFGWVLARTPVLTEETMGEIFAIVERNGYERSVFEMSPQ